MIITYRTAIPSDAPALAHMRTAFLVEARDLSSGEANQAEMEAILLDYFRASLADDSFAAWLAFDGDELIATSGLSFSQVPPTFSNKSGKAAYIMNMYTLPAYRMRGIARALLEKTVDEARRCGYSKITLHATDMGRPLYEKFGFEDSQGSMVLCI